MIIIQTNLGTITVELDHENTPKTAENFATYAKNGFYDGTIFHRVIKGFMIQGGGFDEKMNQKETQDMLENEADKGAKNDRGTLAMARTSDPHSATSQFFINVSDNKSLNFTKKSDSGWGYCVFGKVVDGMDVVEKIEMVATTTRSGHRDVPTTAVVIEKVTVE